MSMNQTPRVSKDLLRHQDSSHAEPDGLDPHEPGAKMDAGKNRIGLVVNDFARAVYQVGLVGTYGAQKYTDHGWLHVRDGAARYTDAMHRHLIEEAIGQSHDIESGLRHAAHAAWCALARLELMLRQEEEREYEKVIRHG